MASASSSTALLRQSPPAFQSKPAPSPKPTTITLSLNRKLPSFRISPKPHFRKLSSGASGARMNATAAASYAAALADVAKATQTLDATAADVERIEKIFSDPPVAEFFASPVISLEKKREVLDQISATSSLQPHTINFLNILIDMKRIDLIKDILKEFELVYNKLTDTELAVVTSVVPLESQHLAQIAKGVQKLTKAKNVRIKTVLDPSLIAGFTIRYGNGGSKLIDMSVKKQLEEIAAQLDLGDIKLAA
uniref:Uncharacterized protein n=1 Tax=Kalanchoe fedtschenkoi TaxID=63787 RepID=A0A7N0VET2_KALFE